MDENKTPGYEQHLNESRETWNAEAASFDNEPDHGLRNPVILAAWTNLLRDILPQRPLQVLDIGCGTGSLSVVLAGLGHTVTGIDLSPNMIAQAQAKAQAAGHSITFEVMDAAFPQQPLQQFDVVMCRHLLWTLPDIDQVLQRWVRLLKPRGRLILIEGFWHTNAGLHSQHILEALPASLTTVSVRPLSDHTALWGHAVSDERYVIVADLQA